MFELLYTPWLHLSQDDTGTVLTSAEKNEASLNIRNEFFNEIKGQRTGTPAKYEEHMVGFNFWAGSTVTFRRS